MKAAYIEAYGGPDAVLVGDRPQPVAGAGQVLVKLAAAALNHLDIWVRMGIPGLEPPLPHILGSDGAGVIEATGPGVTHLEPGTRVLLNPGISCRNCRFCRDGEQSLCDTFHLLGEHIAGTFAEYIAVPAENVYPIPQTMTFTDAAALPLVGVTAWRMLFGQGQLRPGETVLIVGIGGGVAGAALQLALNAGARVFVTSGSDTKLDHAREIGAAATINYRQQKYWKQISELTDGRGVDMLIDSVGGKTWSHNLACLRKGGRLITCGATAGPRPTTHLQRIFWNQLKIFGSTMGSDRDFREMLAAYTTGAVKPVIDRVYPLEQLREAQARMEAGEQFGKLVLTIPG